MRIKSCVAIVVMASFFFCSSAFAETHVPVGDIDHDETWSASSSPYILDGNVRLFNARLTIEPGTIVTTNLVEGDRPMLSVDNGVLDIQGTQKAPVSISGLWALGLYQSMAIIRHLHMSDIEGGLDLTLSSSSIRYSVLDGYSAAIDIHGGITDISSSSLRSGDAAIHVTNTAPYLLKVFSMEKAKAAALGDYFSNPYSASVRVRSSSFPLGGAAIDNTGADESHIVQATGNWWGTAQGPAYDGSSRVRGPVSYESWLDHEPDLVEPEQATVCCSSVLFIPGLEASRLYVDEKGMFGTTTNTLWEPNRNDDVGKLFLNASGTGIVPSVFSGAPIGSILGIYSIYGRFMAFLDDVVHSGSIGEWHGYGYDWRKPIAEVVNGFEKKATTTESLISTVERLAARSQTGKVTIIAHSNGGLVAKYLVKALTDKGEADLIDSVISVAVPYLGTPQAISSLMYGDKQAIAHGLVLKKNVAKDLAANMPSAYSLLPSSAYEASIGDPIVGSSSVSFPNRSLMASAGSLHGILDSFHWPDFIKRWALVGWNDDTVSAVSFDGQNKDSYKNVLSTMGDGTVMAKSAAYDAGTTVSIDLKQVGSKGADHATMLESSSAEQAIGSIVRNGISDDMASAQKIEEELKKIPGISLGEPDYSKDKGLSYLTVSTHSPVELHLYDKDGNHTGLIPRPAGIPADVEDGLYTFFDEDIPGSRFDISDDSGSGRDTSIAIPNDGSNLYTIVVKGSGVGPFDVDISRDSATGTYKLASYADLPATPLMNATATLSVAASQSRASSSAVSVSSLSIDIDGDGSVDQSIKPNAKPDPAAFLELMKRSISRLLAASPREKDRERQKDIMRRIDKLEDMAKAGKLSRLHERFVRFSSRLSHKSVKGISDADRSAIANMIDEFLGHL